MAAKHHTLAHRGSIEKKNARRKGRTMRCPAEELPAFKSGDGDGDAEWELEWKESLLKSAIDRVKGRVNAEHFQIFDLYALRGWPVRKVAQVLSVSVPMVYLAKHRVTAMIKREVEDMEKGKHLKLMAMNDASNSPDPSASSSALLRRNQRFPFLNTR